MSHCEYRRGNAEGQINLAGLEILDPLYVLDPKKICTCTIKMADNEIFPVCAFPIESTRSCAIAQCYLGNITSEERNRILISRYNSRN